MGFGTHPHRDMEIVTWVLQGSLVHQDSEGNKGVIYPGLAQRMSAGTGILHSEKNDAWRVQGGASHDDPVRFIQMWVPPDERSEEHTSELQSLMRISYAVFCLKKKHSTLFFFFTYPT